MSIDDKDAILFRYFELEKQIKIDCLIELMNIGLTRDEAADTLYLRHDEAYKLLRYGASPLMPSEKEEIRDRDNWKCQRCGRVAKKGEGVLQTHHMNHGWDNSPDNLITLCRSCHRIEDAARQRRERLLSRGT